MRRHVIAAFGVLAVLLAGCGGSDDAGAPDSPAGTLPSPGATTATATRSPGDTGTPTLPASRTPSATMTPEPSPDALETAGFVAVVRDRLPDLAADRTDAEIGAVAVEACRALAAGEDAESITAAVRAFGTLDAEVTDDATAREVVKLAIDEVCLDQAARVDEF